MVVASQCKVSKGGDSGEDNDKMVVVYGGHNGRGAEEFLAD